MVSAAVAIVLATDGYRRRWIILVERTDGHGWALPGGYVEPGETAADAAVRELGEATGLLLYAEDEVTWEALPARVVPDPRSSGGAWVATVPSVARLTARSRADFPALTGVEGAGRAEWIPANAYAALAGHLCTAYSGEVIAGHRALIADLLTVH